VRAQVVISKDTIDSPMCEEPHYFIALSKAAYDRFHKLVPDYGVILYDPAFVDKIAKNLSCRQLAIPAKDISVEKFGRPIFANTIMLGALTRKIHYLDKEIVLESILDVIPRFHDENKNAFQLGYDYLAD
jgi:2-oxoglutarate ferredoxin oxidoreductase subunit gamma